MSTGILILVFILALASFGDAFSRGHDGCVNTITVDLSDTTICTQDGLPRALVIIRELFCSNCLVDLDQAVRAWETEGLQYAVLVVGPASRSAVHQKARRYSRLVEAPTSLHFVSEAEFEATPFTGSGGASPSLILVSARRTMTLAYEDLFRERTPREIELDAGAVRSALEVLMQD